MNLRLITIAVVVLAIYIGFGDFLTASTLSTPQMFVSEVGRGIGGAITGVTTSIGNFFTRRRFENPRREVDLELLFRGLREANDRSVLRSGVQKCRHSGFELSRFLGMQPMTGARDFRKSRHWE